MIRREARKEVTRAVEYHSFSDGKKGKRRWRIQPQTIQTACCRKVWTPSSPLLSLHAQGLGEKQVVVNRYGQA